MNRDLKDHQVHVLHKLTTNEQGARGGLAVGQTFVFPRSRTAYTVQQDGSVRTKTTKLSKAERKQAKRARRLDRELATANVVIARAGSSIEDLREQVRTIAQEDPRFNVGAADKPYSTVWVADVLMPEGAAPWRAIIQGTDAKYYEVSFTVADGAVTLGAEAKEVQRKVEYEALTASALAAMPQLDDGAALPESIQIFPPGDAVQFTLQDYPGEVFTMKVDASVAAKANADLQRLIAAEAKGKGSLPFADKNHEDAEATFHPTEIYWAGNDPKTGGVRVKANWTPFGASLVKAKAFKYFSGNFLFNKSAKKFLGLINENIGGLVNRPGFSTQAAFAKADASTPNQNDTMTTQEMQSAITEALKPVVTRLDTLEAKAKGAPAAATQGADLDQNPTIVSLEARLKAMESSASETVKAAAKATVQTIGIQAGRIAAQDTETIAFWETAIAANAKAADALSKMPVNQAFAAAIASGNGGTATGTTGEPEFVQLVNAKAKAGKSKADAVAEAIAENNVAYIAWLKSGAGKL